jgi:putative two-component system response regulator
MSEYSLPEELSSVEEPEELPEELPAKKIGNDPYLTFLQQTLAASPFPYIIIDGELDILWENTAYRELFSLDTSRETTRLDADFPRSLGGETAGTIRRALASREEHYAYRQRVESFHPQRLSVLANLSLTPIFLGEEEPPRYYLGMFDDVTAEQRNLLQNTFISLLEASKLKDNDTGKHIQRVGEYSRLIAEHLFSEEQHPELSREFVSSIAFLAPMHDVGKIGTPDDILNKEGKLDSREWSIMQEHTINGAYILSSYPDSMARQIALFHHEWWDGSGYPYQLAGDMIPLPARIVAMADVYDALRMPRSYKEAMSHERARQIIDEQAGSHFDPDLHLIFDALERHFAAIYRQLGDEAENGGNGDADGEDSA